MLIRNIRPHPQFVKLAKDHSIEGIMRGVLDKQLIALIPPNEEREFVILKQPAPDADAPSAHVRFRISWRKGDATWLWQVPKFVLTSTGDLRKMAQGL